MTDTLQADLLSAIDAAASLDALEAVRVGALGKSGSVTALLKTLGGMSPDERQVQGPLLNGLREAVAAALAARKTLLETTEKLDAANRELRRLMYEAYITRTSELARQYGHGQPEWDNTENMLSQLRLRDEEARMLGFANYAALSLAPKMARDVPEVDQFLSNIAKRAKPFAEKAWVTISVELGSTLLMAP